MNSEKKIVVLDGGFSTQSSTHVDHQIDGDPLWTARLLATSPGAVIETHLDFLRAGAEIIQTNTYQASIDGFVKYLGKTQVESLDLITKAVDLAEEAVEIFLAEKKSMINNDDDDDDDTDDNNILRPLIAGSCGPYGASLHDGSEYTGEYAKSVTKDMLKNWHRPRITALIKSGVDLLALETIPCEIEAIALVELLEEYPDVKAWLTFSCNTDGKTIVDGSDFRKVAIYCYENSLNGQIIAVGINCIAPSIVSSFFHGINDNKNKKQNIPLIIYPNSGETYTVATGWQKFGTEPPIEGFVHEWLDLGVKFVGGCCRTYADDITKIKDKVVSWREKKNINNS